MSREWVPVLLAKHELTQPEAMRHWPEELRHRKREPEAMRFTGGESPRELRGRSFVASRTGRPSSIGFVAVSKTQ